VNGKVAYGKKKKFAGAGRKQTAGKETPLRQNKKTHTRKDKGGGDQLQRNTWGGGGGGGGAREGGWAIRGGGGGGEGLGGKPSHGDFKT